MKTIEELEARLETVNVERDDLKQRLLDMVLQRNDVRDKLDICAFDLVTAKRERDEARGDLAFILAEYANERNEELTEDALCLKIAGLTHQRDEARDTIVALTTAMAEKDLEIATLTAARAESAKWKAALENIRRTNTDLMMQLFEAQEKARAVNIEPVLHENAQLRSKVLGLSAEVERLTNELQRERIGIRPVDEVRSDAYRRGAEAMRDECIGAACGFFMGTTGFCNGDEDELEAVLEALPIPEEP
jgi:chromosome segregation ATPase